VEANPLFLLCDSYAAGQCFSSRLQPWQCAAAGDGLPCLRPYSQAQPDQCIAYPDMDNRRRSSAQEAQRLRLKGDTLQGCVSLQKKLCRQFIPSYIACMNEFDVGVSETETDNAGAIQGFKDPGRTGKRETEGYVVCTRCEGNEGRTGLVCTRLEVSWNEKAAAQPWITVGGRCGNPATFLLSHGRFASS